jgi:fumarate hydratase class II
MANDVAAGFAGAGGYLEMNVYKPLLVLNVMHSIAILTDGCTNSADSLSKERNPTSKRSRNMWTTR